MGKTTEEEQSESGIGSWPGVTTNIKPPNATFDSMRKMANMLLAHAGRGGGRGVSEAAAEIADAVARPWLAPLLDTLCDRLDFMSGNLFDLAVERNHHCGSDYGRNNGDIDGYVGFHAAL
ncbi:dynamin-related protein 5A-like [Cornus florida]|uniref:dynamin-related protein 5A-like n=1 Tax=Cornus florida TaxID=4283 RepID=UPI0028A2B537|nr:dynamin-related protein 5A-like [Cornus florida]XP_059636780.1 dynamin-related protein 5A-like [Cornus florida]